MDNFSPEAVQKTMEALNAAGQATGDAAVAMQQAFAQSMMGNTDIMTILGRWAGAFAVIAILVLILIVIPFCKMFSKMGNKWYEALIPGHNSFVFITNAGKPGWWIFVCLLFLIPVLGWIVGAILLIIMHFSISIGMAKKFGKGAGFGVGMAILPFIFFPILGYGKASYMR